MIKNGPGDLESREVSLVRLQGKVALITGAARGIGRGIAEKLAQEGAAVVVADLNLAGAQETATAISNAAGRVTAMQLDVADPGSARQVVRESTAWGGGHLDILVNNAGINRDAMLHKMTMEQWEAVIRVNLTGVFNCLQPAAILMREQNGGRIINISSASWQGNIGQANYAAAKAGVIGLTKTAARELARYQITVNAICPGFIETEMTRGVPPKVWDQMVNKILLGRVGKPQDVANMVAFLASDEASYITGEVINVGGGFTL